MNTVTEEKYKDITKSGENVVQSMKDLNEKFVSILPKLGLIDQLDKKVEHLEKLAYAIDAYSKRLGETFLFVLFHFSLFYFVSFLSEVFHNIASLFTFRESEQITKNVEL